MVGRGRNWARIIVLILLLLHAPFSLSSIIQVSLLGNAFSLLPIIRHSGHLTFLGPLYQIMALEIQIVAVVLLFQRSSSRWFRAMKKLRTKRWGLTANSETN